MLPPEALGALVNKYAIQYGLRADLLMCQVLQESSGNPFAYRYENGFYERYMKTHVEYSDTERRGRAISFGLLQVMGETARSIGKFTNIYLTAMCDPDIGLDVGCKVLSYYLSRYKTIELALQAYNAGHPGPEGEPYQKEVFQRLAHKEHLKYLHNGA